MNRKAQFIQFVKKYKHAWVFLYILIYLPWFFWLEKHVTTNYYVVQTEADKYIPFIEYFIVPYLLWFFFIAAAFSVLFLHRCARVLQNGGIYVYRDDDIPHCFDTISERTGLEAGGV